MSRTRLLKAAEVLQSFDNQDPISLAAKASRSSVDAGRMLEFGCLPVDRMLGGGLAMNAFHEVRCEASRDAGVLMGFIAGLLARLQKIRGPAGSRILWVRDPAIGFDGGRLFSDGLPFYGLDCRQLTFVEPRTLDEAMWTVDQAAKCPGLAAAILQTKGNPASFDMTASRRLMMRAGESGVMVLLLRQAGEEEASAAATRWLIRPHPSAQDKILQKGIGQMRLALTLERNRKGQTGHWLLAWNPRNYVFNHAAESFSEDPRTRFSPFADGSDRKDAMGKILAFGKAS
jgi:protein ImuA